MHTESPDNPGTLFPMNRNLSLFANRPAAVCPQCGEPAKLKSVV